MEDTFTVSEVAKQAGLTETSVYRHIWNKQLKAYKFAGTWKIKKEDLDKYLKGEK